jgi:hypothetical protein
MAEPVVVGVDLGAQRLGFGIVEYVLGDPRIAYSDAVDLDREGYRHAQISRAVACLPRASFRRDLVFDPFLFAVEDPTHAARRNGARSISNWGQIIAYFKVAVRQRFVPDPPPIIMLPPGTWKAALDLPGNAGVDEYTAWAVENGFPGVAEDRDAAAAACIAAAAVALRERGELPKADR